MPVYVMRDGELVLKSEKILAEAPQVIRDEIEPLRHMADGKMYSSKARFRQATKDAGCVEIGNEEVTRRRRPVMLDRRQRREDIRKAMHDLRDGRAPRIDQILDMSKE